VSRREAWVVALVGYVCWGQITVACQPPVGDEVQVVAEKTMSKVIGCRNHLAQRPKTDHMSSQLMRGHSPKPALSCSPLEVLTFPSQGPRFSAGPFFWRLCSTRGVLAASGSNNPSGRRIGLDRHPVLSEVMGHHLARFDLTNGL
jgi:hypothetical protein